MAIQSFADKIAQEFFETGKIHKKAKWKSLAKVVLRKLDILHYAYQLDDLRSPPGNQLEALKGPLKGYHSIRVNDQFRVVFVWKSQGPEKVQVRDYHK